MTNQPGDPHDPSQESPQPSGQQPYGQQPPQQYGQQYGPQHGQPAYAPDHPRATLSLVLGILGFVICGIVAPFAWRIGKSTMDEIDASHGQLGGRGAAQAGYVLGLIGTILLGLLILGVIAFVLLVVLSASTSYSRY